MPRREKGELVGGGRLQRVFPQAANRDRDLFVKLSERLQKRVTVGTRCLVPGVPRKQFASGVFDCVSARRATQELSLRLGASIQSGLWLSPQREALEETQDSIFSFFLPFFRKDGVRNFFFFLEGDLEGEPSGETGLLVTVSFSLGASGSALAGEVVRPPPLPRFSSVLCSSSFPFTTAGGSFSVVELADTWLPSALLSPWQGERGEMRVGVAAAGTAEV